MRATTPGTSESISSSGVLTFRSAPDYENPADADMDNTYMVTVKADDGTYMNTRDVTVRVTTDVEDARQRWTRCSARMTPTPTTAR